MGGENGIFRKPGLDFAMDYMHAEDEQAIPTPCSRRFNGFLTPCSRRLNGVLTAFRAISMEHAS